MELQTNYNQYTFEDSSIDLVDLYDEKQEKMLWLYQTKKSDNQKMIIDFLSAEYRIDVAIIQEFINQNKVWQHQFNSIFEFPICTEKGDLLGVEAIDYSRKEYYRTKVTYGYGFNYQVGLCVNWIIFVRSVIELMSFYQIKKSALEQSGCLIVSMGGIDPMVITRYKTLYPQAKWCVAIKMNTAEKAVLYKYFYKYPVKAIDYPFESWNDMLMCSLESGK